jgi:tetratricopeptide (TPR) repeat protein
MPLKPLELDDEIHERIKIFCSNGDKFSEQSRFDEAISEYNEAWKLIPAPKNEWEASTWVLTAIADACFLSGRNKSARQALEYAMTCPGAVGNPFLHLRFGQVLYEASEKDAAADELIRAYMVAGEDIFSKDDPKYLNFLRTRAII